MLETGMFLKTISAGLRVLAKGIQAVAEQLDPNEDPEFNDEAAEKSWTETEAESVDETEPELAEENVDEIPVDFTEEEGEQDIDVVDASIGEASALPKEAASDEVDDVSAADVIYRLIKRSKKGIDTTALMEKTGYSAKKVRNNVYRLKKKGRITNVEKGLYVAV